MVTSHCNPHPIDRCPEFQFSHGKLVAGHLSRVTLDLDCVDQPKQPAYRLANGHSHSHRALVSASVAIHFLINSLTHRYESFIYQHQFGIIFYQNLQRCNVKVPVLRLMVMLKARHHIVLAMSYNSIAIQNT